MELFGFQIKRKEEERVSFAPKVSDDGAAIVAEGGAYGTYVDLDGTIRTEAELVNKYREMSVYPEVDLAIDDIINESIVYDPNEKIVDLVLDETKLPDSVKKSIHNEFVEIQRLLEFNSYAYDIFKKWYVDGRLYYHVIIDENKPNEGIKELRYIDPRKIRKIKEQKNTRTNKSVNLVKDGEEYFIYNEKGFAKTGGGATSTPTHSIGGIRIARDSIAHCTSGLVSQNGDLVQSYLHKAIRPLNQLRAMEDSLVIYRISRAPERRIFYIDVGGLPKMKAEQYLRDIMVKFKNKLVYDSASGEIRDDRKFMTMLEDFWLPRREGGKGTEITTLPGGQNLGQMDDVIYFQRKLNRSLNVPISRLEPDTQFNFGRATEISRDEVKFSKFISRLQLRFGMLFTKLLEKQLILKRIMTPEEWLQLEDKIRFQFNRDNYFDELKETEIMRERMALLRDIDEYAGKYYSHAWIRQNILRQTDGVIADIDKEIQDEANDPRFAPPSEGIDDSSAGPVNNAEQEPDEN